MYLNFVFLKSKLFHFIQLLSMKRHFQGFLIILLTLGFLGNVSAQEKQKANISSIKWVNDQVELTILSPKSFYVGANIFVLYIDNIKIDRNKQYNIGKKGALVFYIPKSQFDQIKDQSTVWMTYGEYLESDFSNQLLTQFAKENPYNTWNLGVLKKSKLKK